MSRQTDLQDYTRKVCDPIHQYEKDIARLSLPVQDDASHTLLHRHFEPEMVHIPASDFLFGYELSQEYLPDYYIARTPTTNIQYLAFVQAGGTYPKHWQDNKIPEGKEHHPVTWVSWFSAVAYCDWLSRVTDKMYRLPTEQEWEKAARGMDGRMWPWGNKWQNGLCNTEELGISDTTPVGLYSPQGDSLYGCMDMAGNVWEWTSSKYRDSRGYRVLRGGSWGYCQNSACCAYRDWLTPDPLLKDIGFRCVSSVRTHIANGTLREQTRLAGLIANRAHLARPGTQETRCRRAGCLRLAARHLG